MTRRQFALLVAGLAACFAAGRCASCYLSANAENAQAAVDTMEYPDYSAIVM